MHGQKNSLETAHSKKYSLPWKGASKEYSLQYGLREYSLKIREFHWKGVHSLVKWKGIVTDL
jgi:hypothetical protein